MFLQPLDVQVAVSVGGASGMKFHRRILRWATLAALFIAVSYLTYKLIYPDYTYRYRLELTLEIDGKPYTGSNVIEVRWIGGPSISHQGAYAADGFVDGQAPLIDLGTRGILIVGLINGDAGSPHDAVPALFLGAAAFGNDSSYKKLPSLTREKGRRDLKVDNWPRLMWLPDRLDRASARKIALDEIESVFGPDAHFTSAFVEMTSDPIMIDIDKKLPWYRAWADEYRRQPLVIYDRPGIVTLRPNMLIGDAP
jgi:hypothetical protein